ncbi:MAG: cold shock domain-containing protein [Actinobacteria bacterium]|nr:cold shock domain-containing protein [Actinomycetota bacterium]
MMTGALATGKVVEFHEDRGTGTVRADDGRKFSFHCTSIADGSRLVDVGSIVVFRVIAGHHGHWEASEVTPRPPD